MFLLFEEAGKFLAGRVLSQTDTSAQVELDSGKQLQIPGVKVDAGKRQFIFYRTLP